MNSQFRNCPICSDNNIDVLHSQSFSLMDGAKFLPDSYDLVCCHKCGFVYADTKAKQSDYDKYYCELSKYEDDKTGTGGGGSDLNVKRMARTAKDIINVVKDKKSSILDIGCANGGILALLKDAGYNKLTGLDPSFVCVEKIKENNVKSILGGLFDMPESIKNRKFDCIILSHVMEHVRDLSLAMDNIANLLTKNGILYIEVPNAEKYCQNFIVPYYYFDCEHINHFDLNSLVNLGMNHGLSYQKSIKKKMQVSGAAVYAAIGVFFKKEIAKPKKIVQSNVRKSVLGYIKLSEEDEDNETINKLFISKEKIIVWGAGQFTQRLLKNTKLAKCNITTFIDNDSVKQGQKINGVVIKSPEILNKFHFPVVICSALHSDEIVKEIKDRGFSNETYIISKVI